MRLLEAARGKPPCKWSMRLSSGHTIVQPAETGAERNALGRSRGGFSTKINARSNAEGLSLPETQIWLTASYESADNRSMSDLCRLIWCAMVGLVRSRAALQAEILILRHQLNVLRRKSPKRVAVGTIDRQPFFGLYRFFPQVLGALKILKPETVPRWHRAGFRTYWRWKSRSCNGRPIDASCWNIRRKLHNPGYCDLTHATTTTSERIELWIRVRRSLAKFAKSEASNHTLSLADFTTTTLVFEFW
jgi:hypothetical protein